MSVIKNVWKSTVWLPTFFKMSSFHSFAFSDVRLVQIQVDRGQGERGEGVGGEQRGQQRVLCATVLFWTLGGVLQKPRGLLILRTFSDLGWGKPGRSAQDREGRRKRGAGSGGGAGGGRRGGRQTASDTRLIFPVFILTLRALQSEQSRWRVSHPIIFTFHRHNRFSIIAL